MNGPQGLPLTSGQAASLSTTTSLVITIANIAMLDQKKQNVVNLVTNSGTIEILTKLSFSSPRASARLISSAMTILASDSTGCESSETTF